MITVHWTRLKGVLSSDDDFDFLRIRLDAAPSDAQSVLEAWQLQAQDRFTDVATIGAPVALNQHAWAIYLDGVEDRRDRASIVTDLANALEAAGFDGEIGPQPVSYSPLDDPLGTFALTAVAGAVRLRPGGREAVDSTLAPTREHLDEEAFAEVQRRTVAWCTELAGRSHVAFDVVSVEATDRDRLPLLAAALRNPSRPVALTVSHWPEQARRVQFTPDGHVLLYFGGPDEAWAPAADTIRRARELLTDLAPWLEYGCARQIGEAPVDFVQLFRIYWPQRLSSQASTLYGLRDFEASRIPEAYGMHLLGPAHDTSRLPLQHYRLEPAPAERALLLHQDLTRWFGPDPYPPIDLLDAGRQELTALLASRAEEDVAYARIHAEFQRRTPSAD